MSDGPKIEVDGYQDFCEILRTLKRGDDVRLATWDNLSNFLSYQKSFEIMEKEMGISKKNFIKWVKKGVTGRPPKHSSKIQWFSNKGRTKGFAHYAAEHLDEIEELIKELKESESQILQWVKEKLRQYLPSDIQIPPTKLHVVFGSGDGRIFYDDSTFDVTLLYVLGMENIKGMIAHELHHIARNKKYGNWTDFNGLKFIVTTLEAEGIADMVFSIHSSTLARQDLPIVLMMMQSKEAYARVDEILNAFDDSITQAYPRVPKQNKLYRLFTKNAFHPVGHVMAQRIEKCLGREYLVDTLGKPLEFIRAYQRSAEKVEGHVFSNNTLDMIEKTFSNI